MPAQPPAIRDAASDAAPMSLDATALISVFDAADYYYFPDAHYRSPRHAFIAFFIDISIISDFSAIRLIFPQFCFSADIILRACASTRSASVRAARRSGVRAKISFSDYLHYADYCRHADADLFADTLSLILSHFFSSFFFFITHAPCRRNAARRPCAPHAQRRGAEQAARDDAAARARHFRQRDGEAARCHYFLISIPFSMPDGFFDSFSLIYATFSTAESAARHDGGARTRRAKV